MGDLQVPERHSTPPAVRRSEGTSPPDLGPPALKQARLWGQGQVQQNGDTPILQRAWGLAHMQGESTFLARGRASALLHASTRRLLARPAAAFRVEAVGCTGEGRHGAGCVCGVYLRGGETHQTRRGGRARFRRDKCVLQRRGERERAGKTERERERDSHSDRERQGKS